MMVQLDARKITSALILHHLYLVMSWIGQSCSIASIGQSSGC